MDITKLNKDSLTPHKWPCEVGQVAITTLSPEGYCVEVMSLSDEQTALVRYLDSEDQVYFTQSLFSLVPTGKTLVDLVNQYEPTPVSLDAALDIERTMPDFSKLKTKRKGGTRKAKTIDDLTVAQKEYFKQLLVKRIHELKGDT